MDDVASNYGAQGESFVPLCTVRIVYVFHNVASNICQAL